MAVKKNDKNLGLYDGWLVGEAERRRCAPGMLEGQNGNGECTFENRGVLDPYRLLFEHNRQGDVGRTERERRMYI